ncbi:MAG TPA: WD40 repeat domain-containing protein [Bryobacteraceae bacterium]|nr:WD40 repeat domain-containing protein [Bryobacteraceae bacterium]
MRTIPLLISFSLVLPAGAVEKVVGPRTVGPSTAGPTVGFVYDANAPAIRPIRGIPGAAFLDSAIDLGFAVGSASVSPSGDAALAVSADDGTVRLIRFRGRLPMTVLAGAMTSPDRIVFSPAGSVALLYSASAARLQVLAGLPSAPAVRDLPFDGAAPIAVADDGVAMLMSGSGSAEIRLTDGSAAPPTLAAPVMAANFRRGTHDLVAATEAGDIYVYTDAAGQWSEIRPGDAASQNPVGVQLSADGAMAYVATAGGTILTIQAATGETNAVVCNCAPSGLGALNAGSVYQLTGPADPLLWLFDASQATPRLLFVPRRNSQ